MIYVFYGWSYFAVRWPICSTDWVIFQSDDLCVRRMELFCSMMTYVFDGWSYFAVQWPMCSTDGVILQSD